MGSSAATKSGVLIVDKPAGCTSHDVVQRVRRALNQRSVGHAGTLDPLATGVLVVAVGEGTKLASYLQSADKRYRVTIALGAETDTLDADGKVTATAEVLPFDEGDVERALKPFIGRHRQQAPRISAIKVGGRPLHRRARRGEDVEAPAREVDLHQATVEAVRPTELELSLHCGKGFYVRSLARDLARALGTVGHVAALRRTASGSFRIDEAMRSDEMTAAAIARALIPLREACAMFRRVELTEEGVAHARHGRVIHADSITGDGWRDVDQEETVALFDPNGNPVALGRAVEEGLRVVRGFTTEGGREVRS
jgi:tRNA pseudouridine55 synthase